jgi:hypothetical protein
MAHIDCLSAPWRSGAPDTLSCQLGEELAPSPTACIARLFASLQKPCPPG